MSTTISSTVNGSRRGKVTPEQVIAMRTLKAQEPNLSVQQIKERLEIPLSHLAINATLRGILHKNVDMCGLEPKPFNHSPNIQVRMERREARKAERAARAAQRSPLDIVIAKLKRGEPIRMADLLAVAKIEPEEAAPAFVAVATVAAPVETVEQTLLEAPVVAIEPMPEPEPVSDVVVEAPKPKAPRKRKAGAAPVREPEPQIEVEPEPAPEPTPEPSAEPEKPARKRARKAAK